MKTYNKESSIEGSELNVYSLTDLKQCTKCGAKKELKQFNDTIILTKRGDCKTCESNYTKAYYLANKEKIRANERVRRNRAKKDK